MACIVGPLTESRLWPLGLSFRLLYRLDGSRDVLLHVVEMINLVEVVHATLLVLGSVFGYDGILQRFGWFRSNLAVSVIVPCARTGSS